MCVCVHMGVLAHLCGANGGMFVRGCACVCVCVHLGVLAHLCGAYGGMFVRGCACVCVCVCVGVCVCESVSVMERMKRHIKIEGQNNSPTLHQQKGHQQPMKEIKETQLNDLKQI